MKNSILTAFISIIIAVPCYGMLSEYNVDPEEYSWLLEGERTDFEQALEGRLGRPLTAKEHEKIDRQFETRKREELATLKFLKEHARHQA
jgi:hypothetical protein